MKEIDRVPPHDLGAEKATIGSVFLLPTLMDDMALVLSPGDFYNDANGIVWRAMAAAYERRQAVDVTLVSAELKKAKVDFERIGGYAYLAELASSVPTAANGLHYANIVADLATRRRQIAACTAGVQVAYDMGMDSSDAVSAAETLVFGVRTDRSTNIKVLADVMVELMAAFDRRRSGENPNVVATGLKATDNAAALRCGEMTVLAGRPAMGKTALGINIASGAAEAGSAVLIVSLEMSRLELASRILASVSGVSSKAINAGYISPDDCQRLIDAQGAVSQWRLQIDDSHGRSVSEIASIARRMKSRGGLDLLVIDYLQLLDSERTSGKHERHEQVGKMSRMLKQLARELSIPVLVLCQVNRETAKAGDNRPRLHHLRESGSIEQDADNVLFIHREEYYLTEEQRSDPQFSHTIGVAELIIAKQRNGTTGTERLCWHPETQRFSDPVVEVSYSGYTEFERFNGDNE